MTSLSLFVYTATSDTQIKANLGLSEYSYYFVLNDFYPSLMQLANVIQIEDLNTELDSLVAKCVSRNEPHALLLFSAPQNMKRDLKCPVIPVFAWEFEDMPNETWDENEFNNWSTTFELSIAAITHSQFALQGIRNLMGPDFPAWSIPAPIYGKFKSIERVKELSTPIALGTHIIKFFGLYFDSHASLELLDDKTVEVIKEEKMINVTASTKFTTSIEVSDQTLLNSDINQEETTVELGGVLYTSVFNPADGRKNWQNMIKTFCWAMRDKFDATLILKFIHSRPEFAVREAQNIVSMMPSFKCRILVIAGFLDDHEYRSLINVSTFTVNSSTGEGQCLPLMEYMSAGVPAIAPNHSALGDYVNDENAFIVSSSPEPAVFPHDERAMVKTRQFRVNLDSLADAFQKSYSLAHHDYSAYRSMSESARSALSHHCSDEATLEKLRDVVEVIKREYA